MEMLHLPTWKVDFYGFHVVNITIHDMGSYGFETTTY